MSEMYNGYCMKFSNEEIRKSVPKSYILRKMVVKLILNQVKKSKQLHLIKRKIFQLCFWDIKLLYLHIIKR